MRHLKNNRHNGRVVEPYQVDQSFQLSVTGFRDEGWTGQVMDLTDDCPEWMAIDETTAIKIARILEQAGYI